MTPVSLPFSVLPPPVFSLCSPSPSSFLRNHVPFAYLTQISLEQLTNLLPMVVSCFCPCMSARTDSMCALSPGDGVDGALGPKDNTNTLQMDNSDLYFAPPSIAGDTKQPVTSRSRSRSRSRSPLLSRANFYQATRPSDYFKYFFARLRGARGNT